MSIYPNIITQKHLDEITAEIEQLKLDKDNDWPDVVACKSAEGAIIRLQGQLEEMTRLYKLQSFVVRVNGLVITDLCSYYEAVPLADLFGGVIEPRIKS